MKKLTKLLGGGVAIAALFLASCNGAVTPISSDTVVDLDTPAIYAKAYPGVNIVSWEPVSAASGYDIYRYENDNLSNWSKKEGVSFNDGKYTFEDTKIQNDVKYTYKIMAKGNLRAVSTKDSKLGSVTVTGIVPPKDVSALNLAAYEGGYNGKDAKELSDDEKNNKLLTAEKTKIYYNKGQFNVSFPAKAYLKYSVLLSEGDEYAITKVEPGVTTGNTVTTVNNNSVISLDSLSTYKSGKHAIYIKVASKNTDFHNYELIRVGEVENKPLNLDWMNDGTGTWKAWNEACGISNYYIDNMTTARIKFKAPILSSTKSAAPTSYIKLYRELDGNPGLIAVDAAIKSYTETDGTVYYYADVANDNNYRYVVVVTDGNGAFASEIASTTVYNWKILASGVSASGSPITLDNDGKANDVKWTINLTDTNRTIKGVYSLVWNTNSNNAPVVTDFDKTKALTAKLNYNNTNSREYVVYEKNLADGKAYLLVEYSEPNKNDNYVISSSVTVSNTVAPELKGITGVNVSAGTPTALDTDKKANDIKWTVTLPNTYTTFKAYLLTRDKAGTPDFAEFDTTTALPAVAESATNLTTYYIYTKDIAAEKYASLLVIASRTGYVDSYTVKTANQISANPSFSNGVSLSISNAYDNSTTLATTTAESTWKKNDLIINVSELINETSDSIANYTYELFRTTSTVATDLTNNTITFKYNTADWKSLGKLTMNKSAAYNAAATSNTYVAVYKDTDLADGVYAYKVIKSNGVESASTDIKYQKITANEAVSGIKFSPNIISANWKALTSTTGVAKNDVEIEFQKNNTTNANVTDTATGNVISKVDEIIEEGVTYSLWRTTFESTNKDNSNSMIETVFTKVGDFKAPTGTNGTYTKYTKDAAGNWTSAAANYVDYYTYKYTDKDLSTGKSYKYIVVASKAGYESKISTGTASVAGKN